MIHPVSLTAEDVAFVRLAIRHYRIFAEASERQGQDDTAGKMRAQEFHGEQFLARIEEANPLLRVMPRP